MTPIEQRMLCTAQVIYIDNNNADLGSYKAPECMFDAYITQKCQILLNAYSIYLRWREL